jgi:hypothetical protein
MIPPIGAQRTAGVSDRHLFRSKVLIGDAIAKAAIDNAFFDPTLCQQLFNE